MEHLQVETSQNVMIEHDVASVGDRIVAYLLDLIFMFAYIMLVFFILDTVDSNADVVIYILMAPIVFYSLIFELAFNGQSPGKMIMKLKVTRQDGNAPTFLQYFLRWILRIIEGPFFFYGLVPIITIAVNSKGQRLGDLAAKTNVIKLNSKIDIRKTIHTGLDDNYEVKYSQVSQLTDQDIATVKDVVRYYVRNTNTTKAAKARQMMKQTFEAISQKMMLEPNEKPLMFLKTVVKDYNRYYKDFE